MKQLNKEKYVVPTCTIDVSNKYLQIGLKHILAEVLDEITYSNSTSTQRISGPIYDMFFIEPSNMTMKNLMTDIKKTYQNVVVFIVINKKLSFHYVNLSLEYGATILFKEEPTYILKNKIKTIISLRESDEINSNIIKELRKTAELTDCQQQVIDLVTHGFSGERIAKMLNRSEKTISWHKRSAMKKMGVHTDIELHKLQRLSLVHK